MRVLVDSNILISAALSTKGTPYKAFLKAVTHPNKDFLESEIKIPKIMTATEFVEISY